MIKETKIQDKILVNNKVIKKSRECKYLGLTIDFSFVNHVQQTLKKMAHAIETIGSIGTQIPTSSFEISLISIVLAH